jgi:hypothetical protein
LIAFGEELVDTCLAFGNISHSLDKLSVLGMYFCESREEHPIPGSINPLATVLPTLLVLPLLLLFDLHPIIPSFHHPTHLPPLLHHNPTLLFEIAHHLPMHSLLLFELFLMV